MSLSFFFFFRNTPSTSTLEKRKNFQKLKNSLTVQKLKPFRIFPRIPRPDLLCPFFQIPSTGRQLLLKGHDSVIRPQAGEAQLQQRDAHRITIEAVGPLEAPEHRGEDRGEEGWGRLGGEAGHHVLLRGRKPVKS